MTAADTTIGEFLAQFSEFQQEHSSLIAELDELAGGGGTGFDTLYWDAIDALKGQLGAKASNNCGDDKAEQQTTIAACEQWVTEFQPLDVPLILWHLGRGAGDAAIRKAVLSENMASQAEMDVGGVAAPSC